jgi:hypothetical protein
VQAERAGFEIQEFKLQAKFAVVAASQIKSELVTTAMSAMDMPNMDLTMNTSLRAP